MGCTACRRTSPTRPPSAAIEAQFGRLHLLVNNVGISATKPPEQLAIAGWDRVLAVNLRDTFLCGRDHQHRRDAGADVGAGQRNLRGVQAGLLALAHALANALGPAIRANAICPRWIDTRDAPLRLEDHAQHPIGRVGRPEDIAEASLFLASSAARHQASILSRAERWQGCGEADQRIQRGLIGPTDVPHGPLNGADARCISFAPARPSDGFGHPQTRAPVAVRDRHTPWA